jgi:hypothetical protein
VGNSSTGCVHRIIDYHAAVTVVDRRCVRLRDDPLGVRSPIGSDLADGAVGRVHGRVSAVLKLKVARTVGQTLIEVAAFNDGL